MTAVVARLSPGVDLRVEVPPEIERKIVADFLYDLRHEVDRAHLRYAPTHRGFLLELRERVLVGIDPTRLGRGGVHSFVDKVAYRMWDERRRDADQVRLMVAEDQVVRPPMTGEMPAVSPRPRHADVPEQC